VVAQTQSASAPTIVAPPAAPRPERALLTVHPIEASEGGDGAGATVSATQPIAFDLDARRFPPRAADPVLHVGAQRFVHYVHPSPGVLRFVAADRGSLEPGVRVFVQFGDDASSRTVVAEALELP